MNTVRHAAAALCGLLFLGLDAGHAQEKGQPKYWKDAPDQAEVLSATFLGGKGNEWLVSGGFQPDGAIVVVGNVQGPTFELGDSVQVIGTDLPKPPESKPVPALDAKGKQKTDKEGRPQWEKPSWRHEGTTGFIVHLSSDLKKIRSVHRLPWSSAALTSAVVAKDGTIYIAGRATDSIAKLGGDVQELEVGNEAATRKDGQCAHAFVAQLSADGSKVEWVRHSKGPCDAPQVTLTADGKVRYSAQDVRTLDVRGKVLQTIVVPGGVKKTSSVSPTDDSIVTGGEHHWPTGREPWRCPTLNIHKPDGSLQYQLYDWGGPYVGLDNLRLVSDSAVRLVTHDQQGNILLYAWSDGGNSVMTREPNDVRSSVVPKGLGINAAGAGVLSCSYLIKIEPKECRVIGWTIWLSFTSANKPNSIWIDSLGLANEGSVCLAGRSAWGLMQTRNHLNTGEPSGQYIAVFDSEMSRVRFCSAIPGSGVAETSYENSSWGVVTGVVEGKPRALFVGSAVKESPQGDKMIPTPTKNALQSEYGGGSSDGYLVLLDLSKSAPREAVGMISGRKPGTPTAASFELGASGKSLKRPNPTPEDGTTFFFKPQTFKHVTVDAEFRDRSDKLWPSFLSGKPIDGSLTYKDNQLTGTVSVACTTVCQPKGDQSRRVLGELIKSEKESPTLELTLESLGPIKTIDLKSTDAKGKETTRNVEYREGKGTLALAGKKLAVTPKATFGYSGPKDGGVDQLRLTMWLTLKGADLGLSGPGTEGDIDVRVTLSGSIHEKVPPKK